MYYIFTCTNKYIYFFLLLIIFKCPAKSFDQYLKHDRNLTQKLSIKEKLIIKNKSKSNIQLYPKSNNN